MCRLYKILKALPEWFLRLIFRFVFFIVYLFVPSRRLIAEDNVRRALGGNCKTLVFKTYMYFADMVAFNVKYLGDKNYIENNVEIVGLDMFRKAMSMGRGVIFTTAHFGNWEMLVCGFAVLVEPVHIMVRPLDNEGLDRLVESVRSSCGNVIESSRESVFHFIRILKEGKPLGVLVDQAAGEDSIRIEFFGRKARVNPSIAIISRRLGVPILPAYLKEEGSKCKLVIENMIVCNKTDDYTRDIEETMKSVYSRFEVWIRKEPYKYLWMHNRWK